LVSRTIVAALAAALALGTATTATAAPDPDVTRGPCAYTKTPEEPAARPVRLPKDPRHTPRGKVDVLLRTNQGPIPLSLDRAQAPCTVQSFLHLAEHRFYDATTCHRLTTYPTLKVLQCGDPSGTGEGGPGYRYKDELPTTLPPAPNDPTGERRVYPRGTLAMANAGPDTNGSQFFLVTSDSVLRPDYTVFGTIGAEGLKTLDEVAAAGVAPTPEEAAPIDGTPKLRVDIRRATVEC
jgi:peptidyl-prolyl cis-trans isomerase B (cyclophilin B)